ncbi:MAG: sensor histidine kinase [Flavobacteriia bacterium]|jgi:signal transduction histidine kinase
MKRQTAIIFYLLGIYVFLQFVWWGYHLIELTGELKKEPSIVSKRVAMILGEGLVFFILLIIGLFKIRSSIKKELKLTKSQNNFLLSVTHELKTPLAATRLFLQTIKKHNFDEQKRNELLIKAMEENERLESLIDNILNASRIENNALKPVKTDLNLSTLFEDIIQRFKKRNPRVEINSIIPSDLHFLADQFFIETIIENLLENAAKYGGAGVKIKLNVIASPAEITLKISDNGPGISDAEKRSIFQKFYRSGSEETRSQKGSGLGLFIVSELTRLHNGRIVLKDNTDGGAKFEVTLKV